MTSLRPLQPVDNDVWWYYMLSLSFYWSMTLRHFFDVKHKVGRAALFAARVVGGIN